MGWPIRKNDAAGATLVFPIYDNDGDLVTGAADLDSERSIDQGTFTDVTAEAAEIATSSGMYSLALSQAEINGDEIATITKTSTADAKTAVNVVYTSTRNIDDLAFPTVSGRSTDTLATGEVGVDLDNMNGTLDAGDIGADAITAAKIADDAIAAEHLATGAIVAATFAAGAIDAAAIAADAIGASEIADGAIDAAAFAAGAITAAVIANAAIDAATFAAGAIDAAAIAADAIGSSELATDAIGATQIAAGAITSSEAPNLDAAISTIATPAQVNTEVSDVLKTDTIAELSQGQPSATPTFEDALMLLYMAFRNRMDIDTTATDYKEIYNDAGTVIAKKTLTDDGTIYSEAKMATGP